MSCDFKIKEAVTCKPIVKPIVTMAKGDKTFIRILTLTINEKQCNTVQYITEIYQSAASIRVELMICLFFSGLFEQ